MTPERNVREALILAGGLGTRLRPVVADRPKPVAQVAGRPFLERLFQQLLQHGYERAVLCVGHGADQIMANLGPRFEGLRIDYSCETVPLGTGGALRLAAAAVSAPDILAMNGDSYCDMDLTTFAAAHRNFGGEATIAVLHREDRADLGSVDLDSSGRIVSFANRLSMPKAGLINAGVYLFRRDTLLAIPVDKSISLESEVFPSMVERGTLFGWRAGSRFIDIGTPASYHAAQHFFTELQDDRG